ncbi:MAG TPA: DnaJ domain-containing protein [Candidatus Goldiibacteriota bacterium]|nr:DnaJ domain-containing protein [Candidatus Goldiibacteriota bacterium]HPI02370.1 DnaJ domain-containing protein [Candidatus Goldiibacteriota bacterium]HPN64029.1 DnaJ domain-containing protein [Candidatus Goldiibacteriota bacterium]HRQ44283.1 DnaJ domain-containing protein [Candidatus Goldiibacteriota bacterium]
MANKLNYYELLELYPAATQEEIDGAFRMMLYKYHPDHNPDRPDWAHERTSEVVEAYNILSNPLKRKIYNFIIFASLKQSPAERKFGIFQGNDKKKFEEACVIFKEGVAAFDNNKNTALLKMQQACAVYKLSEGYYNTGVIYTVTNKLLDAKKAFEEAVRLEPENQHYKRVVDRLMELMREIDRARKAQ